jgi:hypothetical protein
MNPGLHQGRMKSLCLKCETISTIKAGSRDIQPTTAVAQKLCFKSLSCQELDLKQQPVDQQ